jgi:hypothetical protein
MAVYLQAATFVFLLGRHLALVPSLEVLKLLLVKERIVATALAVTLTFAVARLLGLTAQAQEATL